jgi:hypothetical protein
MIRRIARALAESCAKFRRRLSLIFFENAIELGKRLEPRSERDFGDRQI